MSYEQLIPHYIEQNPTSPGPDDVRLKEYGVPVWALAGYWLQARQTMDQFEAEALVARDYDLPLEVVRVALAYYEENRCAIDTRLAANEVPATL